MQDRITRTICMDSTKNGTCIDFAAFRNRYGRKVAIDRDVITMTHQYIVQTIILENSRNFSIENGTCLRSRFALNINPFIIQFHITQTIYGILSVMADNHVWTGNGNRQNTPVTFKTARQLAVRFRPRSDDGRLKLRSYLLQRNGLGM